MSAVASDRVGRVLRRVALAIGVIGVAALAYALLTRQPPEVTSASLAHSVEDAVGSAALFPSHCTRLGGDRWTCVVSDNASGGSATYRVEVGSDSCWKARRTAEAVTDNKHMPPSAPGCVQ